MKRIFGLMLGVMMTVYMMAAVGITAFATETGDSIDTSIEKGEELYQKFLNVSAFIEDDSTWEGCMDMYKEDGIIKTARKNDFLEDVAGATEEKYLELLPYETFVYIETYLIFSNMVNTAAVDMYINKEQGGVQYFVGNNCILWKGNNSEEVIGAYEEFVEWQFAYFREHNFPYNFITGRTYAEETGLLPTEDVQEELTAEEQEIADELGLTQEEIQEITDALTEEEVEEIREEVDETEEETSPWGDVLEKLGKMWFTLLVLIVFVVAYLVVRHIRKKTDIDELSDSGK